MPLLSMCFLRRIVFCILIILSFVFALPLLYLIRQIINILLKIYYGKQYDGMIEKADCMWATERDVDQCVTVLFVYKSSIQNPQDFINHVKCTHSRIFNECFPKITSTSKTFMGYAYLLKNQVSVQDAMRIVKMTSHYDNFLEDTELQDIINEIVNKPLKTGLIEIYLIPKPVKWKVRDSTKRHYAVVYKVHHIVGEGLGLLMFWLESFADDQLAVHEFKCKLVRRFRQDANSKRGVASRLKQIFTNMFLLFKIPYHLSKQFEKYQAGHVMILEDTDNKVSKSVNYAIESKEQKLISKMTEIKRNISGATFSSVILTAICRSMRKYITLPVQQTLSLLIVALAQLPDMDSNAAKLINSCASGGNLNLPLLGGNSSTKNTLVLINKATDDLKNSGEVQMNHIIMNYIFELIPLPLLRRLLRISNATACLSSIPGPPKLSFFKGQELEEVVGFLGLPTYLELGFCILTYDDRLHIGITANNGSVSKEQMKNLAESIIEQIDAMYEEVCVTKLL
nr:unnamed protein product [Callosobruchus analis]